MRQRLSSFERRTGGTYNRIQYPEHKQYCFPVFPGRRVPTLNDSHDAVNDLKKMQLIKQFLSVMASCEGGLHDVATMETETNKQTNQIR